MSARLTGARRVVVKIGSALLVDRDQIRLARAYEEALTPHGITTAQVLVTLEDSRDRKRYLNSRATLAQLLSMGVVPIVNENDTVATDEIRYGDNDRLAAADETPQLARKRWIASMKAEGALTLDAGAVAALQRGKSLLPAGVTAVRGPFERGAPVQLMSPAGDSIGTGLSRYTSDEAAQLKGHQSGEIEQILGYPGRAALVHRDDMVL